MNSTPLRWPEQGRRSLTSLPLQWLQQWAQPYGNNKEYFNLFLLSASSTRLTALALKSLVIHLFNDYSQELMSGEAVKERVTLVPSKS